MKVYRCELVTHDYLFFASREAGPTAAPEPYIHNTALLYALNEHIAETQRLVSGTSPHYEEDFPRFTLYATPAGPLKEIPQRVKISYNAVDSPFVFSMEKDRLIGAKRVVPKFGAYYRFLPLSRFVFFAIGEKPLPLIRIGKKRIQARIQAEEASHIVVHASGRFTPSHPVSFLDLPPDAGFSVVHLRLMIPCPLIVGGELEGPHLEATFPSQHGRLWIALPDVQKYSSVAWGYDFS